MTDVEKMIMDLLKKINECQSEMMQKITTNTTNIQHLTRTLNSLDKVVRLGNGSSLVSVVSKLEQEIERIEETAMEQLQAIELSASKRHSSRKEIYMALIAMLTSAIAAGVSVIK